MGPLPSLFYKCGSWGHSIRILDPKLQGVSGVNHSIRKPLFHPEKGGCLRGVCGPFRLCPFLHLAPFRIVLQRIGIPGPIGGGLVTPQGCAAADRSCGGGPFYQGRRRAQSLANAWSMMYLQEPSSCCLTTSAVRDDISTGFPSGRVPDSFHSACSSAIRSTRMQ